MREKRVRRVHRSIGVLMLLALLLGVGSGGGQVVQAQSDVLQIVVTFSVLADLVTQVAGDRAEVRVLVPAGGDAHTFEPTPADAGALEDADLVVENGLGFEPWLGDLYEAADSDAARVVSTAGIIPLEAGTHAPATPEANHEEHGDEDHGEHDPHAWHDVARAMQMVEAIRDALIANDAEDTATYESNAAAYLDTLRALDAEIATLVATLPEERRRLVTSHDTFAYFADRYGFEIVGTAIGSASTDEGDPSAQRVTELVEQIEAAGVPAIFAENVSNPDLMETIAREARVTLAPALYTDALGDPGSPGEAYVSMMRYNATTIVTALAS